jgi:hypothetical protein
VEAEALVTGLGPVRCRCGDVRRLAFLSENGFVIGSDRGAVD